MTGAESTTWNGPIKPWEWRLQPVATLFVTGHFRNNCHQWSMGLRTRYAGSKTRAGSRGRAQNVKISNAFKGLPVAVRPTSTDGLWDVFFMTHKIRQVDLREPAEYV